MLDFENTLEFRQRDGSYQPTVPVKFQSFSEFESGFCWQIGRWGEIVFDFNGANASSRKLCDFIIDVDVFKYGEVLASQNIFFYLNGLRIGSFNVVARRMLIVPFEERILRQRENVITIDAPDAQSPTAFGESDGRILGVQVFTVQIRRAD